MPTAYSRGYKTYYDGKDWLYCDNNDIDDGNRACARCGKFPTQEGYDYCLGYIEGAASACCGHGAHEPILIMVE